MQIQNHWYTNQTLWLAKLDTIRYMCILGIHN
jgi:hypothetical protein